MNVKRPVKVNMQERAKINDMMAKFTKSHGEYEAGAI